MSSKIETHVNNSLKITPRSFRTIFEHILYQTYTKSYEVKTNLMWKFCAFIVYSILALASLNRAMFCLSHTQRRMKKNCINSFYRFHGKMKSHRESRIARTSKSESLSWILHHFMTLSHHFNIFPFSIVNGRRKSHRISCENFFFFVSLDYRNHNFNFFIHTVNEQA